MFRPATAVLFLVAVIAGPAAVAQEVDAPVSMRIYDLRDVAAMIPEEGDEDEAIVFLVDALCTNMETYMLRRGVFMIEGTDAAHRTLTTRLEDLRHLYDEHYELEIIGFATPMTEAPNIGDKVTTSSPMMLTRQIVKRRIPTEIASTESHSYLGDLSPIVGDQSELYDPRIDTLEDGLSLEVQIGAGPEDERGTIVDVHGTLAKFSRGDRTSPFDGDSLSIELPSLSVRTVRSHLALEYGRLTALAVVDGFEPGAAIVIAARVRKISR